MDYETARELFRLDRVTGVLYWASSPSRRAKIGAEAGCLNDYGYMRVRFRGVSYMTHRIVWLLVHGQWPEDQIDHINGVRADNRPENLRRATAAENQQNLKVRKDNTSGFPGVRRSKSKWQAIIARGGERYHLGNFDTPEQAAAAYARAKAELHPFQPIARAA
jgi:hypothetical protein